METLGLFFKSVKDNDVTNEIFLLIARVGNSSTATEPSLSSYSM